ncbi:hypothetical protein NKDENANG_02463 [Candidatus Entotheonellaceae bacterium PAL068K]
MAAALGLDPLQVRLQNLVAPREEVRRGMWPIKADAAIGLRRAAQAIGWHSEAVAARRRLYRQDTGAGGNAAWSLGAGFLTSALPRPPRLWRACMWTAASR